ncbi:hypothetical protein NEOLEDRAFT_1088094 [Neolentinus lepideus HHB14362 ss-1]|uniref:G-protein coupled receptors family 1 profile domain-containing protein n=1 Tax=Neolentinus lepideus HHB14362 ss-1 TaxID=1314782 RepID=A0A165U9N8_9AGAM|nr:hypothetical protein NEOLEDRAFT_1088094 [Neolentinus lepideus HHB14362 ss-1]
MSDVQDDSNGSSSGFVWSEKRIRITYWASIAPTIAALLAAILVIGLAYMLYVRHRFQTAVRRQSFMMLLAVLVASLFYSAAYLVEDLITGPTAWCGAAMFVGFLTSNFTNFVIMCMALNLQLVFIHGKNTQRWIKYYLGLSFLASLATALPGAIRNVWGWDPVTSICYLSVSDPRQRLAWQIGSSYFWMLLSSLVTLVSTLIVLGALIYHGLQRRRSFTETQRGSSDYIRVACAVAWRIMLYPSIILIVNTTAAVSDFGIDETKGIDNYGSYVLWTIYGFFYGAQPLFLALVALLIDPSFSEAVRRLLFRKQIVRTPLAQLSFLRRRRLTDQRRVITDMEAKHGPDPVEVQKTPSHPGVSISSIDFACPWDEDAEWGSEMQDPLISQM